MVKRGDIYWHEFKGTGSVQSGRRPAVVVQWDAINLGSPTTIVAPMTSQPRRRQYPFHLVLSPRETGLPLESTVLCEQVKAVAQEELEGPIGSVSPARLGDLDAALRTCLGL